MAKLPIKVRGDRMNCNSSNVVYLVQCETCGIQYVGSMSTKFCLRFNNYRSCFSKHNSKDVVPQFSFHAHFNQEGHNGINDWLFTFIDQARDVNALRRKECFWQHNLNKFCPNGLNECDVTFDFGDVFLTDVFLILYIGFNTQTLVLLYVMCIYIYIHIMYNKTSVCVLKPIYTIKNTFF